MFAFRKQTVCFTLTKNLFFNYESISMKYYLALIHRRLDFTLYSKKSNSDVIEVEREIDIKSFDQRGVLFFVKDEEDRQMLLKNKKSEKINVATLSKRCELSNKFLTKFAQAEKAYKYLENIEEYDYTLNSLQDNIFDNNNPLFSKEVPFDYFSSIPLMWGGYRNADEELVLPYPFIFTSTRKKAFQKLLPFPKKEWTFIQGCGLSGKNNFACRLTLLYRTKKFNHAVIYITNFIQFKWLEYKLLLDEIFFWFYEEIKDSLIAQNIINSFFNSGRTNSKDILSLISYLMEICHSKNKKIIFIMGDNKYKDKLKPSCKKIIKFLSKKSCYKIFLTRNADIQRKQKYEHNIKTIILKENEHPIKKEQLMDVIMKMFFKEVEPNIDSISEQRKFAEYLCILAKNHLFIVLNFYYYCHYNKKLGEVKKDLKDLFHKFSRPIIQSYADNVNRLSKILSELHPLLKAKAEEELKKMTYFYDSNIPNKFKINSLLIDRDFFYISDNGSLKTNHSLINLIFVAISRETNDLAQYINKKSGQLSLAEFRWLFKTYIERTFHEIKWTGRDLKFENEENKQDFFDMCTIKKILFNKNDSAVDEDPEIKKTLLEEHGPDMYTEKEIEEFVKEAKKNREEALIIEEKEFSFTASIRSLFRVFDLVILSHENVNHLVLVDINSNFFSDKLFWIKMKKCLDNYEKQTISYGISNEYKIIFLLYKEKQAAIEWFNNRKSNDQIFESKENAEFIDNVAKKAVFLEYGGFKKCFDNSFNLNEDIQIKDEKK